MPLPFTAAEDVLNHFREHFIMDTDGGATIIELEHLLQYLTFHHSLHE